MNPAPYTKEELEALNDEALPERGEYCPKCKGFIPSFDALNRQTEQQLRSLGTLTAIRGLRDLTGCNLRFAKAWALHPGGPHPRRTGPPCPYCGKALFTAETRQCIQCGWDWHDPSRPVQHPVSLSPELEQALARDKAS